MSGSTTPAWLLLAVSLPGNKAGSARVRLWRTLKDAGAATLRDGVTLVPALPSLTERVTTIAKGIEADGGAAWMFAIPRQAPAAEKKLQSLFDRTESYRTITPLVADVKRQLTRLDETEARRHFRRVESSFQSVAAVDFFPGAARARALESLDGLRTSIERRFSPAEPSRSSGRVGRRKRRDYQGARWATRRRLWVDRAASAWLIQRFIDPRARFLWLAKPADCPADAHGFDFDGATFTHINDLVTFEVLLQAFDLGEDAGLARLAQLVRYLDLGGGDVVAEAAGFEAVLAGLRETCATDDDLLAAVTPVLDALHQHFSQAMD